MPVRDTDAAHDCAADLMTKTTRTATRSLRAILAVLVLAVAGLAGGAAPAAAAPPCWKQVLNDWFVDGRIDGSYPVACYTEAQQHLGEDAVNYSGAPGDIQRALLAAIRQDRGSGSRGDPPASGGTGGSGSSGSGPTAGGGTATPPADTSPPPKQKGPIQRAIDKIGPSNAESVPLPLLVLAAIALLLLAAAGASFAARRIQARRVRPAPAPAPRPPDQP
jgi:hypothetical protein